MIFPLLEHQISPLFLENTVCVKCTTLVNVNVSGLFYFSLRINKSKNKLASTFLVSCDMHNKPTNLEKGELCFEGDLISKRIKQSLNFDNKLGNKRNQSH